MRRISVEAINDGDILARDIFSSSGVILMSEGVKLKKEYIPRLLDLHIDTVFIYEDLTKETVTEDISEEEIKKQCEESVRNTIQR